MAPGRLGTSSQTEAGISRPAPLWGFHLWLAFDGRWVGKAKERFYEVAELGSTFGFSGESMGSRQMNLCSFYT